MAKGVVVNKKVTSVPQPAQAEFLHGTFPPSPNMSTTQRVKPGKPSEREYGKKPISFPGSV